MFVGSSNLNFVRTLLLLRIPQQAKIASCSGFRKCKGIPQIYPDSVYNFRNPLTVCRLANFFVGSVQKYL